MSHLGWVTAFYLVANHLMVKGILFLTAAAVIFRLGRGMFVDVRGVAWSMPYTFAAAAVAIVAMSGLPPLAGFGAKWLLLSALMEKGWYGQVVVGVLSTFVGFLYMARFIWIAFLSRPAARREHDGRAHANPGHTISADRRYSRRLVLPETPHQSDFGSD